MKQDMINSLPATPSFNENRLSSLMPYHAFRSRALSHLTRKTL